MFAGHPASQPDRELMYVHIGPGYAVVELLPWMWIMDGGG